VDGRKKDVEARSADKSRESDPERNDKKRSRDSKSACIQRLRRVRKKKSKLGNRASNGNEKGDRLRLWGDSTLSEIASV